jgi:hypothetical protein
VVPPSIRDVVRAGLERGGATDVLETWCDVPFGEAYRRYAERAPLRHPGHVEHEFVPAYREMWSGDARPLALGPVLRVPTDAPVDVPDLAARVRRAWAAPETAAATADRAAVDGTGLTGRVR